MEWQMTYKPDRYFKDICCSSDDNGSSTNIQEKQFYLIEYFPSDPISNKEVIEKFVKKFHLCVLEIQKNPRFLSGFLLKDAFDSGKFPFLNIVYLKYDEDNFISPSKIWLSLSEDCSKVLCEKSTHSYIAGFEEYELLALCSDSNQPKLNSVFFISSFKASGNLEWLEKNWRQWTGVVCILKNLSHSLRRDLQRISFYRRVVPIGEFMYVLMCEFTCENSELYRFKDLIERMNERYSGYSQVYVVHSIY